MSVKPKRKSASVTENTDSVAYGLPPMAQTHYHGSRHLHPERLPSARRDTCVSVRLLDVSKDTIENIRHISENIKRLFASRLQLKAVPSDLVQGMVNLQKLDLSDNTLSDGCLPDAIKLFDQLMDLNLSKNKLTKLPSCVRKLKSLIRMDISHNKLENVKGIEKAKKLQILTIDDNKLESLFKEISSLRNLEILHCGSNKIKEIGHDIRHLKNIKELHMSGNRIMALPVDLFQLPQLEVLDASFNRLSRVPTFNIKTQNKHCIADVDLSENSIAKFPEHLLLVSDKLDLSGNNIKTIGWNVLRKIDWNTPQVLLLENNPLTVPPEDVCESGIKAIISHMQEVRLDIKIYQGIKILMLGSHRSGKTSLVQSIVDEQSRLSEELIDPMVGIDVYETVCELPSEDDPSRSLNLCFWDFCGHQFYMYPHYIFFEHPTVTALTFNMAEYTPEKFQDVIGSWFDWMIAKTNKLVVVVIGTHADALKQADIENMCADVKTQLNIHLSEHRKSIERKIKFIEEKPHISPVLSEQLKAYMALLKSRFSIQADVIPTSAKTCYGFDKFQSVLVQLSEDKKLFPNVLRPIPTFWTEVEYFLEERGESMTFPVMEWDEYFDLVTDKFGMKHLMTNITQYLHDIGKIIWFSNIPSLKRFIFLRPTWVFDIMKFIYRHDMNESLSYGQNDSFKDAEMSPMKFGKYKRELLDEGVVEKDFLRCMFSECIPMDDTVAFETTIPLLLHSFDLGYPVQKRSRDASYKLTLEPDADGNVKLSRVLLPWFLKNEQPEYVADKLKMLSDKRKVVAVYKFPAYMPPGLFEVMSVRAHRPKHKLKFLSQWRGGIHARHQTDPANVVIDRREVIEMNSLVIRFDVRDDTENPDDEQLPAAMLWSILLPLLMEFEDILQGFVGR